MTSTTQEQKSPSEVFDAVCPICPGEVISNYIHKMQDSGSKEISYWNQCQCGIIWQHRFPEEVTSYYDNKYVKKLLEDKEKYSDSCYYYARVYGPIIEEMIYGRKVLDVGYLSPYNMEALKIRGWVPFGIEVNQDAPESGRLIRGNFEDYKFPEAVKYDMLWMNHVLENFKDPVKALEKASGLLSKSGILFIATADAGMVFTKSISKFHYWREHENHIMWSKKALIRKLEELGFEITLVRKNHEPRFTYSEDLHVIAQKRYF